MVISAEQAVDEFQKFCRMVISAEQAVDEFQKFCAEQGVDWRECIRQDGCDKTARFIQSGVQACGVDHTFSMDDLRDALRRRCGP